MGGATLVVCCVVVVPAAQSLSWHQHLMHAPGCCNEAMLCVESCRVTLTCEDRPFAEVTCVGPVHGVECDGFGSA